MTLTWQQARKRTLLIRASKRHGAERTVRLLDPLAKDLAEWRLACGRPERGLVFPFADGHVAARGRGWTAEDWDNWRERVFRPAAVAAGLARDTRPRDLRGSFATLLIYEGQPVTEIARQLGHSAQTCLRDCASVFEEFDPAERVSAEDAIRAARDAAAMGHDEARGATG